MEEGMRASAAGNSAKEEREAPYSAREKICAIGVRCEQ